MTIDIALLEQAWLKAETTVDQMKQEALKATAELAKMRGEGGNDFSVLVATIEQLKARQEEAEQTASDAFDRYWMAQGKAKESGSAYA